jgi:hypothetical protein
MSKKLSESKLRYLISNAKKSGFDKCLIKLGNKTIIDKKKFAESLKEKEPKQALFLFIVMILQIRWD